MAANKSRQGMTRFTGRRRQFAGDTAANRQKARDQALASELSAEGEDATCDAGLAVREGPEEEASG